MNSKKLKKLPLVFLFVFLASVCSMSKAVYAVSIADVVAVVDESGSMLTEHAWLGPMVGALDTELINAGVSPNQYGLTGFAGGFSAHQNPHKHPVGGGDFGTAAQFSTATGGLVLAGGVEDGWWGIDFALNNYTYRAGSSRNLILVTDEDRDNLNNALSFNSIDTALSNSGTLLNAVVNHGFFDSTGTTQALGVDALGNAYFADGLGGFTSSAGHQLGAGWGTTFNDYVQLAWNSGGAAWDLNQLRAGGLTAQSFTAAFVDIKVAEIVSVPEPATMTLLGIGLFGLVGASARRKLKKKVG